MNYEEKYKQALERAKYWEKQPTVWDSADICQKLFPELLESELESEDERIKKCIGMCLTDATEQRFEDFNTTLKDCLTWLEKQGEKNEIDYDEELKKCKDNPLYFFDKYVKIKFEKQGEKEPIEQDTEIRDLWEYIQEWRKKFGRLPKDADELAACIYYVIKR